MDDIYKLFEYATDEDLDGIKRLIEAGVDINGSIGDGFTALIAASMEGYTEIVKYLVEKGAKLDLQDDMQYTALIHAIKAKEYDTAKFLIEKGANLDIKNGEGDTALSIASLNKNIETATLLVEKGADMNLKNKSGRTALIQAAIKDSIEIVTLLVEKKANLDIQDNYGSTALIVGSVRGHTEIVRLLVEKGAKKNLKNKKGKTAYDVAKGTEIKELLGPSEATEKWKGFTKSDVEKFDVIFDEKAVDYSVCPVCIKYVERSEACMYMSHNCTDSGGYYHRELYNKYKNDEGRIYWCTCCSRICMGHRHYELVSYKAKKPDLLSAGDPFEKDCRKTNEGGGPPEKLARFRRLREHALELQEDIDKKDKDEVLDELVEEVWNAPLARTRKLEKIAETKQWNIPSNKFSKNTASEANNKDYPNLPYDGKEPTEVEKGRNNVMMNDDIPVLRFHHKQKDGSEESHGISKETLEGFIADKNKNFGDESFGFCFMYPGACDSRLHPQELKGHVPEDLYKDYKKKFNAKFKAQAGGNRGNVLHEATDAVCAVVKKRRGGSRKKQGKKRGTRRI